MVTDRNGFLHHDNTIGDTILENFSPPPPCQCPPPMPMPPPPPPVIPGRDADQGPQGVWVWKLHPPVSDWVSGGLRGSKSSARQPVPQAADT